MFVGESGMMVISRSRRLNGMMSSGGMLRLDVSMEDWGCGKCSGVGGFLLVEYCVLNMFIMI